MLYLCFKRQILTDLSVYDRRGVSASKSDVHAAIKGLDKGLFPLAFCKILPDMVGFDSEHCNIMHADTAGTKTALAYLYWRETGDLSVWKQVAQDAMVMNIDDMGCVGCVDNIVVSSTIGRNKHLISGDVIKALITGNYEFVDRLKSLGISLHLAGGETADVGDIVRTVDVGITAFARIPKKDLVVNDIRDGNVIVGVASYGQATYEDRYNSGIGSNGLTSARHDVLAAHYGSTYPESADPNTEEAVKYIGSKRLTDIYQGYEVGHLLLSPTRSYLPILKPILDAHRDKIDGMIHNTGGGLTKVKHFIKNKHVVKNNLLALPPVFQLIQSESKAEWREMYQVFNMGQRLEIYTDPETAKSIIKICSDFNLDAQVMGFVEDSQGEQVSVKSKFGEFTY